MPPDPSADLNAAPGFDDPLAGLSDEIPDEEYMSRLEGVNSKIAGMRKMIKGYAEGGDRIVAAFKGEKVKALNRLFAFLSSMGFDLNDPQSLNDLLSRLTQADPRWADLLSGLLDTLDPEKGAQPGKGIAPDLGEESPLNPLIARRIAEEMGVEMPEYGADEGADVMGEDGDGSVPGEEEGEGAGTEPAAEPAPAPKPKKKPAKEAE